MQILVSEDWLKATGNTRYIDKPFTVIREQAMPRDGEKMYHVEAYDGWRWVVWSIRGITVIA